ncbi:hypothetical protein [Microbacterium sp. LMI1x-1-1.1]|uniref:hypothetical protein n=1 Tax=Microbacterium sp. LMI1x-1-1.1 TaxID=3135246 RepID=UPI003417CA6A
MTSELDFLPQGPQWGSDTRPVVKGVLSAVNAATLTCQVSLAGQAPVWMPYVWQQGLSARVGEQVWVQRDPISGRAVLCLGLVGGVLSDPAAGSLPRDAVVASTSPFTVTVSGQTFLCGQLSTYTPTVGDRVLLHWSGVEVWAVGKTVDASGTAPAAPTGLSVTRNGSNVFATWDQVARANLYVVQRSLDDGVTWNAWTVFMPQAIIPMEQGQRALVRVQALTQGVSGSASSAVAYTWAAPNTPAPSLQTFTTTIRPTWSGTWFPQSGHYGLMSVDGGKPDPYDMLVGSALGEGPFEGMALYGDQITLLGAESITSIELTVRADRALSVDVQGATERAAVSGAPHPVGAVVTVPAVTGVVRATLPSSIREAFRTGATGSLRVVSDTFGKTRGISTADGMALNVTYTKTI